MQQKVEIVPAAEADLPEILSLAKAAQNSSSARPCAVVTAVSGVPGRQGNSAAMWQFRWQEMR